MEKIHTAIIGGGAAGMFCAAALSGKGVLILERGERLGRKLSATGNGQGNVTNLDMSAAHYFSSDVSSVERISRILSRHGREELVGFLENLGGLFLPDERGRVYPAGRQASAVTDLLRYALADKGVRVRTGTKVVSLAKKGDVFELTAETDGGKEVFQAENVVLCAGGKAAKNFGTDGNGYALAKGFGHTVTPLYPSLVQLKTETAHIKGLKGIRAEARVSARAGGQAIAAFRGDVIFTDYGVSGDAIFRLSAFVTDKLEGGDVSLSLEFLPDVSEERLSEILARKAAAFALPDGELLCGILNNQLGRAVTKRCGSKNTAALAKMIKDFTLPVTGSLGFDYAQVTKGGVPLAETQETLESRLTEGLYFAGEILDADGECGGYNLQWAYASARTAADGINARGAKRKDA